MYKYSEKSKEKLMSCDDRLQQLFNEVIKYVDCSILEGHRGKFAQNEAFKAGKSKAQFPYSNHNSSPSMAADVVPYPVDWDNLDSFHHFAGIVKGIAFKMGIKIKWGGEFDGGKFFDGAHYELTE